MMSFNKSIFLSGISLILVSNVLAQGIKLHGFEDSPCFTDYEHNATFSVIKRPARIVMDKDMLFDKFSKAISEQNYDKVETGSVLLIVLVNTDGKACLSSNERATIPYLNTADIYRIVEQELKWEPDRDLPAGAHNLSIIELAIKRGKLKSVRNIAYRVEEERVKI